jgi:hypothetical protein
MTLTLDDVNINANDESGMRAGLEVFNLRWAAQRVPAWRQYDAKQTALTDGAGEFDPAVAFCLVIGNFLIDGASNRMPSLV